MVATMAPACVDQRATNQYLRTSFPEHDLTSLLISDIFPPKTGGSGRWFWEIYRRQPRDEFVAAVGQDAHQHAFDRTHDLRLARVPLALPSWGIKSWSGFRSYFQAYRAVRRVVRDHDVDMVHSGRLLPEAWIAWMLKKSLGISYLCYVHGEELHLGIVSREFGWMMRRILKDARLLVANSNNTRRLLLEHWQVSEKRIRVLHPGVDVDRFVPTGRDKHVRAKLGWADRPVVLTVGRLQMRKGHDQMIRSLAAIKESIPNVLYAIVGDGEERGRLERCVREFGVTENVQFLGEVDDEFLYECYQQCDLFVLPNRDVNGDIEGFGMVLLEAQACGKPVVAGASGGTAETMRDPETGRVVPCDGPDELTTVVRDLLGDAALRDRMGRSARAWVERHFSWASLSDQAYDLFIEFGHNQAIPSRDDSSASMGVVTAP